MKKKEAVKPKTIVICTPGSSFSRKWVECYLNLVLWCFQNGYQVRTSFAESNNIYYVRNKCLGADVLRGKDQKPFNGQLDYDYLLWIDSDTIFNPPQLDKLIKDNKDIVGVLQAFEDGSGYTCGNLDEEYFKKTGIMPYHTDQSLALAKKENGLVEVDYIGLGFLLVKKGVTEMLEYPWFEPHYFRFGETQDFSMEDVGWCIKTKGKGFKVYVDTQVRVGHEKKAIY